MQDGSVSPTAVFGSVPEPDRWSEAGIVQQLVSAAGEHGLAGLTSLVDRVLEDDGVTYTPIGAAPAGAAEKTAQRWPLDPIPLVIDGADWMLLEAGLLQRARLLNAVLLDIYGSRSLISRGLIPAPLIFRHDHYLRPAHGIRIPGMAQLFFHAVDLARTVRGDFVALSDRAQAPSGAGYAMADRRVLARVLPDLFRRVGPRGLSTFFHTMLGSLQALAPATVSNPESPRVVVLSPGTHSETAFDQAFLASLLGVPLVESADLTVRAGRLFMRALGHYEPVDVVLRRVDAAWSDPLDLRPDSELGVVGLLEACRRGTVTVVNTLGSGAVENPGLLPLLPELCHELLGESLLLPSVTTVWCGRPEGLTRVLDELDDLVIKPLGGGRSYAPATLAPAVRAELVRRIRSDPDVWVGQSRAEFGPAATVEEGRLIERRAGLRTFAVAHQGGWTVMPGGLGRVVGEPATEHRSGAVAAKDVWVRSAHPDRSGTAPQDDSGSLVVAVDMTAAASRRVLEDLFWLGRYAERAEDLTRLLITAGEAADGFRFRAQDAGAAAGPVLARALAEVAGAQIDVDPADPLPGMRALVLRSEAPGTVAHSFAGLQQTARSVRISSRPTPGWCWPASTAPWPNWAPRRTTAVCSYRPRTPPCCRGCWPCPVWPARTWCVTPAGT